MTDVAASPQPTAIEVGPDRSTFLESVDSDRVRSRIERLSDSVHYDLASLFPKTAGLGAGRQAKKKVRLLKAVEPILEEMLYEDEVVLYVTKGIFSSFLQQYFLGLHSYMINRATFVFTNLRVIQFNTRRDGRPRWMKWQIAYDSIGKYQVGGLLSPVFKLRLKHGPRYKFTHLPRYDAKPLRRLLDDRTARVDSAGVGLLRHGGCDALCNGCHAPVPPGAYICEVCSEQFVKPIVPAALSLALPGLGEFYMGHAWLGALELFGYGCALYMAAMMIMEGDIPLAVGFLFFIHLLDALITYLVARRGLLPKAGVAKAGPSFA